MESFFSKKISIEHIIWSIILFGFFLYGKMLFNGFVGDDAGYIQHPYIQNFQLLKLFQSGSADLGGTSPITGQFFRPLMLVAFSILYNLFSNNFFFYHLFQLVFHIANVILLFFLFRKFFQNIVAGILSLIYLVHPINVETVAYISDLQDVFFVFFGLISLNLLFYKPTARVKTVYIPLLLFLSLLSKETGILFIGVIFIYTALFKRNDIKLVSFCLFITLSLYSIVRFFIAGVGIGNVHHTPLADLSLQTRLFYIPSLVMYYIQTLIYPKDLAIGQTWTQQPTFHTFFLPLIFVCLLILFICIIFWYLKRRKNKNSTLFFFFSLWFFMGLAMHLQFIPLEMTVADRWFYFPFIGLLGMLGLAVTLLTQKPKNVFLLVSLTIIICLSVRTFIRLDDWRDAVTLYKHDTTITESYLLEHSYGYELMQRNDLSSAYIHLKKSVILFPTSQNRNSLGVYFFKVHNTQEAVRWFTTSLELGDNYLSYHNLIHLLLMNKSFDDAQKVLLIATQKFPKSDTFWYLLTLTEYQRGNKKEALLAAQHAFTLSPSQKNAYVLNQLRLDLPLKIAD